MSIRRSITDLWTDQSAVTTTEYAFLLATFVLVIVVGFANLTDEVQTVVNTTGEQLRQGSGIGCTP